MAQKTYRAGRRRRRSWKSVVLVLFALGVVIGGYYAYQLFLRETETVIKNPSANTVKSIQVGRPAKTSFDESGFVLSLPEGWKKLGHNAQRYNKYSYQSGVTNAQNRFLDVYMDAIPTDLAVNKTVAVRAESTGSLTHGMVSDNCITFTNVGSQQVLPARWDGVDFLCDNGSIHRNVIGTSSPGMINKVRVSGQTTGAHEFFFVYTDHNHTPDYTILYDALTSFRVK